ncbi:toxin-antitoxin system YwqK family antitoxin [Candidatus Avelusimicrobium faecicola]|uniref:toxin-antitoxin system YwqK family antitoxin n=1 Tax=Candidatus Avelusimicrobium faecicola TaxID=3416205 RepID=UPI0015A11219|nr:toxin-antitoxin system YwqK family antitoxin [Spirochaetota bacterium]MDY6129145.1 toxin-antitoxin system YwqK family antitoxin [Elusimicrobiaceae bacterium]
MKEKTICIVTPDSRTYYRALPLAKEYLDKDHNVINTAGKLPDGQLEQIEVTNKTVKTLKNGKIDGVLEVINLAENAVTFSELYQDGQLIDVKDRTEHGRHIKPAQLAPKASLYPGTVIKSSKGSRSFYVQGKEVAEETLSSNGTTVELLGQIPDGDAKEFNENGQVVMEAVYQNNQLNGEMVQYDESGEIISREMYVNGMLQGEAHYYQYRNDEKFWADCSYDNSLLHGNRAVYYPDGTLKQEENYRHGKLSGIKTTYYSSGKVELRENYTDGKLTGERTLYFPDGNLWYQENYKAGRLEGDRVAFFPNGVKRLEEFYVDGMMEGIRKVYAESGELLTSEEYHWGALVHNTERHHG